MTEKPFLIAVLIAVLLFLFLLMAWRKIIRLRLKNRTLRNKLDETRVVLHNLEESYAHFGVQAKREHEELLELKKQLGINQADADKDGTDA